MWKAVERSCKGTIRSNRTTAHVQGCSVRKGELETPKK
jgi:hypothetical protein